jgi:hypothetical protein
MRDKNQRVVQSKNLICDSVAYQRRGMRSDNTFERTPALTMLVFEPCLQMFVYLVRDIPALLFPVFLEQV